LADQHTVLFSLAWASTDLLAPPENQKAGRIG
jgi:hypothetical protein